MSMAATQELSAFLDKKAAGDFVGRFILLSDSATPGSFLVHYFISQALKDGHRLCLVAFAQSFTHYVTIAAKMGVNLTKLQQQGKVVFVDCLTHLLEEPESHSSSVAPGSVHQNDGSVYTISIGKSLSLKGVFEVLQSVVGRVRQADPDKPVCLVLDDLSVLLSLGVGTSEVVGFSQHCQYMMLGEDGEELGYFVAMVHSDRDVEDEEEELLHHHLLHHCHLHLLTEGLHTGYSRDVHGELTVEWRDPAASSPYTSHPHSKTTQYKVVDKGVHLFARGMSKNVL